MPPLLGRLVKIARPFCTHRPQDLYIWFQLFQGPVNLAQLFLSCSWSMSMLSTKMNAAIFIPPHYYAKKCSQYFNTFFVKNVKKNLH